MQFLDGFEARLERRLNEMREEAGAANQRVISDANARGAFNNSRRLIEQLETMKRETYRATDWALREATRLPGQWSITREFVAPILRTYLGQHIENVFAIINPNSFSQGSQLIEQYRAKQHEILEGEIEDFRKNIWHPRNENNVATPQMNTNNTVNIHGGSQQGVNIQQAGSNSNQQATFQFKIEDAEKALNAFAAALQAANLDASAKHELEEEVSTIQTQLKRAKPNHGVIHAAVYAIQHLAIAVGAEMLVPYVQALMQVFGLG